MPQLVATIDYQKCLPGECDEGLFAAIECLNKVLR